jgi:hypothetical protein
VHVNSEYGGDPPDWPHTEPIAAIDVAIDGLHGLDELAIADHVARFDAVHTALTEALASIDEV